MNNKEIDEAFKGIQILAEQYLSKKYPDAADPDDYIMAIQTIIKAYRNIDDHHPETEADFGR